MCYTPFRKTSKHDDASVTSLFPISTTVLVNGFLSQRHDTERRRLVSLFYVTILIILLPYVIHL